MRRPQEHFEAPAPRGLVLELRIRRSDGTILIEATGDATQPWLWDGGIGNSGGIVANGTRLMGFEYKPTVWHDDTTGEMSIPSTGDEPEDNGEERT